MKKLYIAALSTLALISTSCRDDSKFGEAPIFEETAAPDTPVVDEPADEGAELYRPQIHFTPKRNWMNDPNGMVKVGDTYHLFYQYNPADNNWGNLSWGHATSKDLFNWEEQEVALRPDELGMIFSGCAVVDENNTAGFGAGAVVAFYTSSDAHQQQSMAYSTDGGMTFTKNAANPVIANSTMPDFRDPKVFWHTESNCWVMCLAKGWSYGVDIYTSSDLKAWQYQSTFTTGIEACKKGQWECPDLIRMTTGDGTEKWVMLVSVNPGGPAGGSGTMYFVGDFDGKQFTAADQTYPMWLDYGPDNYAGVTWSNTPGRLLLIGWMNNWNYAGASPCSPWRSAMTLPRELGLATVGTQCYLTAKIPAEIDGIASEWQESASLDGAKAYQVNLKFYLNELKKFALGNAAGECLEVEVNPSAKCLLIKRNGKTGKVDFAGNFSLPAVHIPLNSQDDEVELNIYVDQSSVEILTADGLSSATMLVYPGSIYSALTLEGSAQAQYRTFSK